MKNNNNDFEILEYMIGLCNRIDRLKLRFGDGFEFFLSDEAYQLSICMKL